MFDTDRRGTTLHGAGLEGVSTLLHSHEQLQRFSSLPDLEITPIYPNVASKNKAVAEHIQNYLKKKKVLAKDQDNITKLLQRLPILSEHFELHSKIGEGTYSSVYLASVKNGNPVKQFALKHLTDNSNLARIQKELRFMQKIGGRDNVVNVLHCLKNKANDCVVFVMPYLEHKRFGEYVTSMDTNELRVYMKNLFIALRRVHSFNVIHRDVKPGNFLYNRDTKKFLLVDFGLAQEITELLKTTDQSLDSNLENMPINYSKRKRSSNGDGNPISKMPLLSPLKSRENIMGPGRRVFSPPQSTPVSDVWRKTPLRPANAIRASGHNVDTPRPVTIRNKRWDFNPLLTAPIAMKQQLEKQQSFTPLVASPVSMGGFVQVRNSQVVAQEIMKCACAGLGAICSPCASMQTLAAPRAGTPGFRPPEVLLKHMHQTTAVDMWSAGVVLLCVLSGRYPFFKSPCDLAALSEIINIFGTDAVGKIAKKFERRLTSSRYRGPLDLKKVCKRLRTRGSKNVPAPTSSGKCELCQQSIRSDGCVCYREPISSLNVVTDGDEFPDSAYHLLYRLLDLDPATRITAAEALNHPFITQANN